MVHLGRLTGPEPAKPSPPWESGPVTTLIADWREGEPMLCDLYDLGR